MANVFIPKRGRTTASIVRHTRDTRNTVTTIAADVVMSLQPAGGGLRFFDMAAVRQNLYHAIMLKPNTAIKQGDFIRRTGENDLTIERIDTLEGVQELILSEAQRSR